MKLEEESVYELQSSPTSLRILCVTWNLFGSIPPRKDLSQLVRSECFREVDVIAFGTQESVRSLSLSLCCEGKQEWEIYLQEELPRFTMVATETLVGLHLALFIRNSYAKYVEVMNRVRLKGGFCNMLGNKGAISLQIAVFGQALQFINCHLTAHQEEQEARNILIQRIVDQLVRKDEQFDVFFFGDFNYRIDMSNAAYQERIKETPNTDAAQHYSEMIGMDQLRNQPTLKPFLSTFGEGAISFPPTYKLGVNDQTYENKRVPGWTDRIFWRRNNLSTFISYGAEFGVFGSDHRPVTAVFRRLITKQNIIKVSDYAVVKTGCLLI